MLNNRLFKLTTWVVLTAFIYSFVVHDPLLAITTMIHDQSAAEALQNRLESFVLPYKFGRFMGGAYTNSNKLVIFIQDLHCHPEVQKNIYEIIKLLDKRFNIGRILVEGAPSGKVDTSILGSIPNEKIKKKALTTLLDKGLISGAEYYSVVENQDKLYGLEQWDVYEKNLARIQKLIGNKEANTALADELVLKIDDLKAQYLSPKLKSLEHRLIPSPLVGEGKGEGDNKRYLSLEKLGQKAGEDTAEYPNLSQYIRMLKLNNEIKFKRLPGELSEYISELKKVVPYSIYKTLLDKLAKSDNQEEYTLALSEIAEEYTPQIAVRYPNAAKFLEYVRLNYTINPINLVSEENAFSERILNRSAETLMDREIMFLSRMTRISRNFVDLKVTTEEYDYFKQNIQRYRALLQKYIPFEEIKTTIALMSDKDFYDYYEANLSRNDIFINNIIQNSVIASKAKQSHPLPSSLNSSEKSPSSPIPAKKGPSVPNVAKKGLSSPSVSVPDKNYSGTNPVVDSNNTAPTPGYRSVLSNIENFKNIEIVVTGGFHTEIVKTLESNDVSYLAVTPNVTQDFNDSIYEKVLTLKITPKDVIKVSSVILNKAKDLAFEVTSLPKDWPKTLFLSFPGLTGESSVVDIKSLDTPVKPEYDGKNSIMAHERGRSAFAPWIKATLLSYYQNQNAPQAQALAEKRSEEIMQILAATVSSADKEDKITLEDAWQSAKGWVKYLGTIPELKELSEKIEFDEVNKKIKNGTDIWHFKEEFNKAAKQYHISVENLGKDNTVNETDVNMTKKDTYKYVGIKYGLKEDWQHEKGHILLKLYTGIIVEPVKEAEHISKIIQETYKPYNKFEDLDTFKDFRSDHTSWTRTQTLATKAIVYAAKYAIIGSSFFFMPFVYINLISKSRADNIAERSSLKVNITLLRIYNATIELIRPLTMGMSMSLGIQNEIRQSLSLRLDVIQNNEGYFKRLWEKGEIKDYNEYGLNFTYALITKSQVDQFIRNHKQYKQIKGQPGFAAREYINGRTIWHIFVVSDLFGSKLPDEIENYVAIHEHGEEITGQHHIAMLGEFIVAEKEGNLKNYIKYWAENSPYKLIDSFYNLNKASGDFSYIKRIVAGRVEGVGVALNFKTDYNSSVKNISLEIAKYLYDIFKSNKKFLTSDCLDAFVRLMLNEKVDKDVRNELAGILSEMISNKEIKIRREDANHIRQELDNIKKSKEQNLEAPVNDSKEKVGNVTPAMAAGLERDIGDWKSDRKSGLKQLDRYDNESDVRKLFIEKNWNVSDVKKVLLSKGKIVANENIVDFLRRNGYANIQEEFRNIITNKLKEKGDIRSVMQMLGIRSLDGVRSIFKKLGADNIYEKFAANIEKEDKAGLSKNSKGIFFSFIFALLLTVSMVFNFIPAEAASVYEDNNGASQELSQLSRLRLSTADTKLKSLKVSDWSLSSMLAPLTVLAVHEFAHEKTAREFTGEDEIRTRVFDTRQGFHFLTTTVPGKFKSKSDKLKFKLAGLKASSSLRSDLVDTMITTNMTKPQRQFTSLVAALARFDVVVQSAESIAYPNDLCNDLNGLSKMSGVQLKYIYLASALDIGLNYDEIKWLFDNVRGKDNKYPRQGIHPYIGFNGDLYAGFKGTSEDFEDILTGLGSMIKDNPLVDFIKKMVDKNKGNNNELALVIGGFAVPAARRKKISSTSAGSINGYANESIPQANSEFKKEDISNDKKMDKPLEFSEHENGSDKNEDQTLKTEFNSINNAIEASLNEDISIHIVGENHDDLGDEIFKNKILEKAENGALVIGLEGLEYDTDKSNLEIYSVFRGKPQTRRFVNSSKTIWGYENRLAISLSGIMMNLINGKFRERFIFENMNKIIANNPGKKVFFIIGKEHVKNICEQFKKAGIECNAFENSSGFINHYVDKANTTSELFGLDILRQEWALQNIYRQPKVDLVMHNKILNSFEKFIKNCAGWELLFDNNKIIELRKEIAKRLNGKYETETHLRDIIEKILSEKGFLVKENISDELVEIMSKQRSLSADADEEEKNTLRTQLNRNRIFNSFVNELFFQFYPDDFPVYRSVKKEFAGRPGTMGYDNGSDWGVSEAGKNTAKRYAGRDSIIIRTTFKELRKNGIILGNLEALTRPAIVFVQRDVNKRIKYDVIDDDHSALPEASGVRTNLLTYDNGEAGALKNPGVDEDAVKLSEGQYNDILTAAKANKLDDNEVQWLLVKLKTEVFDMVGINDRGEINSGNVEIYFDTEGNSLPSGMNALGQKVGDKLLIIINKNYLTANKIRAPDADTLEKLAIVIDHEWEEHMAEPGFAQRIFNAIFRITPHRRAAARQKKYFTENKTRLSKDHAEFINELSQNQHKYKKQIQNLINEYNKWGPFNWIYRIYRGWGKYEKLFYQEVLQAKQLIDGESVSKVNKLRPSPKARKIVANENIVDFLRRNGYANIQEEFRNIITNKLKEKGDIRSVMQMLGIRSLDGVRSIFKKLGADNIYEKFAAKREKEDKAGLSKNSKGIFFSFIFALLLTVSMLFNFIPAEAASVYEDNNGASQELSQLSRLRLSTADAKLKGLKVSDLTFLSILAPLPVFVVHEFAHEKTARELTGSDEIGIRVFDTRQGFHFLLTTVNGTFKSEGDRLEFKLAGLKASSSLRSDLVDTMITTNMTKPQKQFVSLVSLFARFDIVAQSAKSIAYPNDLFNDLNGLSKMSGVQLKYIYLASALDIGLNYDEIKWLFDNVRGKDNKYPRQGIHPYIGFNGDLYAGFKGTSEDFEDILTGLGSMIKDNPLVDFIKKMVDKNKGNNNELALVIGGFAVPAARRKKISVAKDSPTMKEYNKSEVLRSRVKEPELNEKILSHDIQEGILGVLEKAFKPSSAVLSGANQFLKDHENAKDKTSLFISENRKNVVSLVENGEKALGVSLYDETLKRDKSIAEFQNDEGTKSIDLTMTDKGQEFKIVVNLYRKEVKNDKDEIQGLVLYVERPSETSGQNIELAQEYLSRMDDKTLLAEVANAIINDKNQKGIFEITLAKLGLSGEVWGVFSDDDELNGKIGAMVASLEAHKDREIVYRSIDENSDTKEQIESGKVQYKENEKAFKDWEKEKVKGNAVSLQQRAVIIGDIKNPLKRAQEAKRDGLSLRIVSSLRSDGEKSGNLKESIELVKNIIENGGEYAEILPQVTSDNMSSLEEIAVHWLKAIPGLYIDITKLTVEQAADKLASLQKSIEKAIIDGQVKHKITVMVVGTAQMTGIVNSYRQFGFESYVKTSETEKLSAVVIAASNMSEAEIQKEMESLKNELNTNLIVEVAEYKDNATKVVRAMLKAAPENSAMKFEGEVELVDAADGSLGLARWLALARKWAPIIPVMTVDELFKEGRIIGRAIKLEEGQFANLFKSLKETISGKEFSGPAVWALMDIIAYAMNLDEKKVTNLSDYANRIQEITANMGIDESIINRIKNIVRTLNESKDVKVQKMYLAKINGILSGILGTAFLERSGLNIPVEKADVRAMLENYFVELSRYIVYRDGRFMIDATDKEKAIEIMPAALYLLNRAEREKMVVDIYNSIEKDNWLLKFKLVEAVKRSADTILWEDTKRNWYQMEIDYHKSYEKIEAAELLYWANFIKILYPGRSISDKITNPLKEKISETNKNEMTHLLLSLSAGELMNDRELRDLLGQISEQEKAITDKYNVNNFRALRAIARQNASKTAAQVEIELAKASGQLNLLAMKGAASGMPAKGQHKPEEAVIAVSLIIEDLLMDRLKDKNIIKNAAKTGSLQALRSMLTAG